MIHHAAIFTEHWDTSRDFDGTASTKGCYCSATCGALLQERVDYVQNNVYFNSFRISSLKKKKCCCSFGMITEVSYLWNVAYNYLYISNWNNRMSSNLSSPQPSVLDGDSHIVLFCPVQLLSIVFSYLEATFSAQVNLLKAKRNLLYIRNESVPHSKHFPPRL